MHAWLAPRWLMALLVSLLVHLLSVFGEPAWHYLTREDHGDEPALRQTARKLQSQQLGDEGGSQRKEPVDELIVQLGHPAGPTFTASEPVVEAISAAPSAPAPAPRAPHPAPSAEAGLHTPPPAPTGPAQSTMPDQLATPADAPPTPRMGSGAGSAMAVPIVAAAPAPVIGPFPHKVEIGYIVKGLVVAEHRWQAEHGRYQIDTRGSFLGKSFAMHSEGEIGPAGLKPLRFVGYRDNKPEPRYAVDFDWAAGQVTVGEPDKRKTLPLQAGAQDVFSAAYQFALLGEQQPRFDLQVITGRNAYQITFSLRGEAELTLSGRKITTLVMAGAHEQRQFAFFLAPEWHNLPVRIRYQDGDTVHELMAVEIRIDGKSVLERSKPAKRER